MGCKPWPHLRPDSAYTTRRQLHFERSLSFAQRNIDSRERARRHVLAATELEQPGDKGPGSRPWPHLA